jgi:hypothetical protein
VGLGAVTCGWSGSAGGLSHLSWINDVGGHRGRLVME